MLLTAASKTGHLTDLVDPEHGPLEIELADAPVVPDAQTIRGIVVSEHGQPIEGALVSPTGGKTAERRWSGRVDGVTPVVSDHEGRFAIVLREDYLGLKLEVGADGYAGTKTELIDAGTSGEPIAVPVGATVVGTLTVAGRPAVGQQIAVVQTDRGATSHFIKAVAATSDAQGRFSFENLPASQEYVVFSPVGAASASDLVTTTKRFRVPESGAERDLGELTLQPGLRFSGHVTPPDGESLPEQLQLSLGRDPAWDLITIQPDGDGAFEITGLPPETYEVRIGNRDWQIDPARLHFQQLQTSSFGVRLDESISDIGIPIERKPREDRPSRASYQRAKLEPAADADSSRGVTLAGRVFQDGAPRQDVRMVLFRHEQLSRQRSRPVVFGEVRTDEHGDYSIAGLEPGDYYHFELDTDDGSADPTWMYGGRYRNTVPENARGILRHPDVHLVTYNQSLAGKVVDLDGNPIAGIRVMSRLRSGEILSRRSTPSGGHLDNPPWTDTDDDGSFILTELPDAPIWLMAYRRDPAGGRVRHAANAMPNLNQRDIRILLDPSLLEETEDLDAK